MVITANIANAQPEVEWMRLYGENTSDEFRAHVRTENGGWAFAGVTGRNPNVNWLVTTDAEGEPRFVGTYNIDDFSGLASDLVQTEDGGYLLAGNHSTNERADASAIRVNANGDEIWERLYGDAGTDGFSAVAGVKEDRFIFAGLSSSWVDSLENGQIIAGGICGFLVFINGNGEIIWQNIYGGVETDILRDVIVVEGGFVAAGNSRSLGDDTRNLWLLRVDEEGREVWSFGYGNEAEEHGWAIIRTEEDNGFAIAGWEDAPDPLNEGERLLNAILLKLDENGEEEWFNRYPFDGLEVIIRDVVRTPDGGYALVGTSREDNAFQSLAYILYLDNNGEVMWSRSDGVDNATMHEYFSAALAEDGGVTTTGHAQFNPPISRQGLFAKITSANLPPVFFEWSPEDSVIFLKQNDDCAFSVDARDPEGADLIYEWTLNEQVVGDEEIVILEFPELGDFRLTVEVSDGVHSRFVSWQIHVFRLISEYSPLDSALTVVQDTTIQFLVQPGIEDDTLTFLFTLDGDSIGNSPLTNIQFDDLGEHLVQGSVMARGCCDSVVWHMTVVEPNLIREFPGQSSPTMPVLFPPNPNPFNSTTSIKYFLPAVGMIQINLFNAHGRLTCSIVHEKQQAGAHIFNLNAADLSTGIYIIRFQTGGYSTTCKAVVMK